MFEDGGVDVPPLQSGQRLPRGVLFGAGRAGCLGRQEYDRLSVTGLGDGAKRGQPDVERGALRGGEQGGSDGLGGIFRQERRELDPVRLPEGDP